MVDLEQNAHLLLCLFEPVRIQYLVLLHCLHGEVLFGIFLLDQVHLTERTAPNDFQYLEIRVRHVHVFALPQLL